MVLTICHHQQNKELLTLKYITLVLIIAFFILAPVMVGVVDEKDSEAKTTILNKWPIG